MRIRSIRPEFWEGQKVRAVGPWARLLLLGLNNYCDDHGRAEWDLPIIKTKIFPTDRLSIKKLMMELVSVGAIVKYEVAGKTYFCIPNWSVLQHPNRPQLSKLPPFTEGLVSPPTQDTDSLNDHGANAEPPPLYSRVGDSRVEDSKVEKPALVILKTHEQTQEPTVQIPENLLQRLREPTKHTGLVFKQLTGIQSQLKGEYPDFLDACFEELHLAKTSKGYKCQSDYHTIQKWVIGATWEKWNKKTGADPDAARKAQMARVFGENQ